jgi:hypothetical protein
MSEFVVLNSLSHCLALKFSEKNDVPSHLELSSFLNLPLSSVQIDFYGYVIILFHVVLLHV